MPRTFVFQTLMNQKQLIGTALLSVIEGFLKYNFIFLNIIQKFSCFWQFRSVFKAFRSQIAEI